VNEILVKALDLVGRPVVTLGGDRRGEIKDVVLGLRSEALVGFTLRNPGFLGGPRSEVLPWESVHAVGPAAVMIAEPEVLAARSALPLGDAVDTADIPVMTDAGDVLGRIVDVVLVTGSPAQVVGLEMEAGEAMPSSGERLLLPIDAVTATSAEAMVVPAGTTHFVHDDLSGFGAAVDQFRSSLGDER
jgi:sporulation protein YlmC with PRC-barrel domain